MDSLRGILTGFLHTVLVALALVVPLSAHAQVSGAIFTTIAACDGTNINIFGSKDDVYLDGGPAHPGAAGLPDGAYYVKVTEPNGTLLGLTLTASVNVTGGAFDQCYQLSDILVRASDNSVPGYDDTSNTGGEYKVWASQDAGFAGGTTKTDNFKVNPSDPETPPPEGTLIVKKFYDANANGQYDVGEIFLTGWGVEIKDGIDLIRFTPVTLVVAPDDYSVTEFDPVETNWIHTTANPVSVTVEDGTTKTVLFGNVCLGAGGGLTLGFWSNKNGQAQINDGGTMIPELTLLSGLNLRAANGSAFDPANYAAFRTWILGATATNMAYMLSAQLAAMELNVEAGFVSPSALVYAPGATSANTLGFTTISALMAEADASLAANGLTVAASPTRTYQEALKNALDRANNNLNFVQSTPCAFSFAE